MLGSHRLGAIIEVRHLATKQLDGCACTVFWPALLYYSASALLAMQTAVIATGCLSVRHIPLFCPDKWRYNLRFSASDRTIFLVSGDAKFILLFAGDHPQHSHVDSENLTNNRCKTESKYHTLIKSSIWAFNLYQNRWP